MSLIIDRYHLLKLIPESAVVLDCTVGTGQMSRVLLERGNRVYGCDCCEEKVKHKNYSHYRGYFQSFIQTQEFLSANIQYALIDLGISDVQAGGEFSYYSKRLRFHLTEKYINFNNKINTITTRHLTKMCNSRNIAQKIIQNRPIKSNIHLTNIINCTKIRNRLFYNLFNLENRYLERCCEGICNLLINKKNITLLVFAFCNEEIKYIRGLKFFYNIVIEEIPIIPVKTHYYLFRIHAR